MTRLAILQSNYIPWKGYFDIIAAVDVFVLYDRVQYTKNDWRNRNRIKSPAGPRWLTVPVVKAPLATPINQIEVADCDVLRKHWSSIDQYYRRAGGFSQARPQVAPLFDRESPPLLSDLNASLLRAFCDLLGITTKIVSSDELSLSDDRNRRLVEICEHFGADRYLSGRAAASYLDEDLFAEARIAVDWMSYDGYRTYDQPHPPFDHFVSIVDLVLSAGPAAPELLLSAAPHPKPARESPPRDHRP